MLALTAAFALAAAACDIFAFGGTDGGPAGDTGWPPGGLAHPNELPSEIFHDTWLDAGAINRNAPSAAALAAGGFANMAQFDALLSAAGGGFQGWTLQHDVLTMIWTGRNFSHFNSAADALASRALWEYRSSATNWATSYRADAWGSSANRDYVLTIYGPVNDWGMPAGLMMLDFWDPHSHW